MPARKLPASPPKRAQAPAGREITASFELLIEKGQIGFAWLDNDLKVVGRQGPLTAWITPGAPVGRAIAPLAGLEEEIRRLGQAGSEPLAVPNVAVRAKGLETPRVDLQVHWQDGLKRYLIVISRPIAMSEAEIARIRGRKAVSLAESELVARSKELDRANAELSRANRDLEEFAYVISHDLKAPLRALRITADLLDREEGEQLSAKARERVSLMRQLARRMSAMMTGLLEYSRIGRKKEAVTLVDTAAMVKEITQTIGLPDGLKVELRGVWPKFETLSEPLDLVLRNLIENAVKHHDTHNGQIVLSAEDRGEAYAFTIADDGPGIPPDYHGAVFEPFRKVDQDAKPESSGIGLALVKKTVELAGGAISLQSDPAERRGVTFTVLWPKRLPEMSSPNSAAILQR